MPTAQLTAQVTTKGVAKADSDLKKLSKSSKTTSDNVLRMEDRFKSVGKNASAAIAAVDGPLGGISSRVSSLVTVLTSGTAAATGFGVAIAGVGAALVIGTKNLDEYNVNLARNEQLLRATGNAAGFTAEQLQEQASALALATLTSTKEVQQAQAQLLTFSRVSSDVFEDAIRLSQDLAETGFGSITSNATQLGKALQDPINGISALTRVGVSFNDTQKEMIRSMQEAGDVAGAQAVVIAALQGQVGGAGAAVAQDSLAGKVDTAGQKWEEFTIALAQNSGTIGIAGGFVDGLASSLQALTDSLTGPSLAQEIETASSAVEAFSRAEDVARQRVEAANEQLRLSQGNYVRRAQASRELRDAEVALSQAVEGRTAAEEKLDDAAGRLADKDQERADAAEKGRLRQLELDQEAADARAAIETEKTLKEAAEQQKRFDQAQTAALAELTRLEAANDTELEAIARREFDKLELVRGFREQGLISEQEFTDAETNIIQTGADARAEIRQKETDDAIAEAKRLSEEQERIDQRRNDLAIDALRDTTSSLKSALGEQNAIYKATAITKAIIDTYSAANAAYAALAGIPIVGPALGGAAAGVAIGAGLANVSQIASAREQGGTLGAGQRSTIAERGSIEVIEPSSNSRVRTAQQMRQMMGEGGSSTLNLTVIDQSTGQKDFTTETQDNGDMVLLIQDTVSNDLNQSNSKIAKARKNTRNQAGF